MREIKFRAWDKENKRMENCISINPFHISDCDRIIWKHNEVALMQYIGLRDKNGVEIYEGDIVAIEHGKRYGIRTSIFKIELDISLWGYEYNWEPIKGYFCTTHILNRDYSNCEVIGNIYENPELLGQSYD